MKKHKLFLSLCTISLMALGNGFQVKANENQIPDSGSKHQYRVTKESDNNIYESKTTLVSPSGRKETISSTGFYNPKTKVGEFTMVQPDGTTKKVIIDKSENFNN